MAAVTITASAVAAVISITPPPDDSVEIRRLRTCERGFAVGVEIAVAVTTGATVADTVVDTGSRSKLVALAAGISMPSHSMANR